MALDADPLERHITGRTVMVTVAAASMGFVLPFALVVSVTVGIACGGLWVWGKERAVGAS